MAVSLFTIAERTDDPLVTVDYNGDERDPAWRAYCESGYWAGSWQHADDYLAWGDAGEDDSAWQAARAAAEQAAQDEGDAHRADVHND